MLTPNSTTDLRPCRQPMSYRPWRKELLSVALCLSTCLSQWCRGVPEGGGIIVTGSWRVEYPVRRGEAQHRMVEGVRSGAAERYKGSDFRGIAPQKFEIYACFWTLIYCFNHFSCNTCQPKNEGDYRWSEMWGVGFLTPGCDPYGTSVWCLPLPQKQFEVITLRHEMHQN